MHRLDDWTVLLGTWIKSLPRKILWVNQDPHFLIRRLGIPFREPWAAWLDVSSYPYIGSEPVRDKNSTSNQKWGWFTSVNPGSMIRIDDCTLTNSCAFDRINVDKSVILIHSRQTTVHRRIDGNTWLNFEIDIRCRHVRHAYTQDRWTQRFTLLYYMHACIICMISY